MNDDALAACAHLMQFAHAVSVASISNLPAAVLTSPGLYAVWVNQAGAADLSRGTGLTINPGLVYVGQSGAQKPRQERLPVSTVGGRWAKHHLGASWRSSTVRLTVWSALGPALDGSSGLTAWMVDHLLVGAYAVPDRRRLYYLEREVIAGLDPALNLPPDVSSTPLRSLLSSRRAAVRRGADPKTFDVLN